MEKQVIDVTEVTLVPKPSVGRGLAAMFLGRWAEVHVNKRWVASGFMWYDMLYVYHYDRAYLAEVATKE